MLFLNFGDIFTYEDKQYVYLAIIDQTLYAALIVGPHQAKAFVAGRDASVKSIGEKETSAKPVYCFVELQTEGYEDHIASLARTDDDKNPGRMLHGDDDKLCIMDITELREEIIRGTVPGVLKEHVRTLEIAVGAEEPEAGLAFSTEPSA
jgi:hypothetical protein